MTTQTPPRTEPAPKREESVTQSTLDAEIDELLRARRATGHPIVPEPDDEAARRRGGQGGGLAGALLIGCGALLLLGQLTVLPGSLFVGALGLAFVAARLYTGRYGFAVPAGLLLALSGFVFFTERWRERASTPESGGWFFLSMAVGFAAVYVIGGRPLILWPAIPAAVLGAIGALYLQLVDVAFLAPYAWLGTYWPGVLLVIGGWLLVRDRFDEEYRRPLALLGTACLVLYGALAIGAAVAGGIERAAFMPVGVHGFRIGDPRALRGSGAVVTQLRQVAGVTGVILEGGGEVTIRQGSVESLTIEAEDNLLPALTSEVRGGTLTLGTERSIWPTRPIRYQLTVRRLERLELTGGGAMSAAGIETDRLRVRLDGGGALTLAGRAGVHEAVLSGAGRYDAAELATRETSVELNGAGYAVVNAAERLRAEVNGVGVIEYTGSPQVERSINGVGTIRQRS